MKVDKNEEENQIIDYKENEKENEEQVKNEDE